MLPSNMFEQKTNGNNTRQNAEECGEKLPPCITWQEPGLRLAGRSAARSFLRASSPQVLLEEGADRLGIAWGRGCQPISTGGSDLRWHS